MTNIPLTAWAGPVLISFDSESRTLTFEAWTIRDGERRLMKSFYLKTSHFERAPEAVNVLEQVVKDTRGRECPT